MKEIKISELEYLKEELEDLKFDESLSILDDSGDIKYVVFPYETIERIGDMMQGTDGTNVKVVTPDGQTPELSYEEYEAIKSSVIKTLEENFKPKANKLN